MVPYSNNVYRWTIISTNFTDNTPKSDFIIDFPLVSRKFNWRFELNKNHSFTMTNSHFLRNEGRSSCLSIVAIFDLFCLSLFYFVLFSIFLLFYFILFISYFISIQDSSFLWRGTLLLCQFMQAPLQIMIAEVLAGSSS